MELTERELATVLAGLRLFQQEIEAGENVAEGVHFAECDPLDDAEIDDLCERLNESP